MCHGQSSLRSRKIDASGVQLHVRWNRLQTIPTHKRIVRCKPRKETDAAKHEEIKASAKAARRAGLKRVPDPPRPFTVGGKGKRVRVDGGYRDYFVREGGGREA